MFSSESTRNYHLFVVTYRKNALRQTTKVRATDKRRAKTLAKQKFGTVIDIVSVVRWNDFIQGRRR